MLNCYIILFLYTLTIYSSPLLLIYILQDNCLDTIVFKQRAFQLSLLIFYVDLCERRNIIFHSYSIMTEVIVETQELQLFNILEVVETKLIKNFILLQRKLNKTEQAIIEHSQTAQQNLQSNHQALKRLEQLILLQDKSHAQTVEQLNRRIASLEEKHLKTATETESAAVGLKRLNDELFNTQLQFQQKIKYKEKQIQEINQNIQSLTLEHKRLIEQMNKKENKVEAQKIIKETELLKDKNTHFQNQLKVANHKIQKIEILNQKAERLQAKKEIEIMKQIEEKVKKELKGSNNTPIGSVTGQRESFTSITMPANGLGGPNNGTNISNFNNRRQSKQIQEEGGNRRPSIALDEIKRNSLSLSGIAGQSLMLSNIFQKWGDKIKHFEVQLKQITENLKVLNRSGAHRKTEANKQNTTEGIKDKINEIKPQIVKLWAKLDTLEDRLSFNQRKLQEKIRNINDLTTVIKENNVSRLDEKLKTLQTEVFTNLKEIKSKLQTRVGQVQYDKYRQQMEEKILQINDLIYLKSDKLQVKKALLFLQSKIKEIILVISQDEQNEKDALLTKKQLKCISCDKELDKFSGIVTSAKGNWDNMPFKDHPPEILGRFGMTNFGSLAKKIKKLEGKDLPLLNKKSANQSFLNSS